MFFTEQLTYSKALKRGRLASRINPIRLTATNIAISPKKSSRYDIDKVLDEGEEFFISISHKTAAFVRDDIWLNASYDDISLVKEHSFSMLDINLLRELYDKYENSTRKTIEYWQMMDDGKVYKITGCPSLKDKLEMAISKKEKSMPHELSENDAITLNDVASYLSLSLNSTIIVLKKMLNRRDISNSSIFTYEEILAIINSMYTGKEKVVKLLPLYTLNDIISTMKINMGYAKASAAPHVLLPRISGNDDSMRKKRYFIEDIKRWNDDISVDDLKPIN